MRATGALLACLALASTSAFGFVRAYVEPGNNKAELEELSAGREKMKGNSADQDKYFGGFRELYQKFNEKVVVPGYISAAGRGEIAKIVGPDVLGTSFRLGDTLFLRWTGSPAPQVGAIYSVHTPAIVIQNTENPTDFTVGLPPTAAEGLPKNQRLAGYFFEGSGRVRIVKISQGLVEAVLETQTGQVQIGDQLMPALPVLDSLKPSYSSIQLSAAVVCGSPADRISTTRNSFIYINRGSRDGVKVGQMFEAVERVALEMSASAMNPEMSAGQAIVVHVSDSYSTAMITKQFDVIRMGSLIRTMNPLTPTLSKAPFTNMGSKHALQPQIQPADEIPEVPNLDDSTNEAPNLPDPMQPPKVPAPGPSPLSDLDALERSQNFQNLNPEERNRLSRLSRQERVGEKGPSAEDAADEEVAAPSADNSFAKGKKPAKKNNKKKKVNDEEELNNLMMQN